MKNKIGYNRLGRSSAHRKAMTRNMLTSLFRHERIRTTKAKALAVRRTAEKMITRSKVDSVHNRRMIGRDIKDKAILAKMFTEIGPRYQQRPGGYTRVLKLGPRRGDAAEMVLLELVRDAPETPTKPAGATKRTKKDAKSKPEASDRPKPATAEDAAPTPPVEEAPEPQTKEATDKTEASTAEDAAPTPPVEEAPDGAKASTDDAEAEA